MMTTARETPASCLAWRVGADLDLGSLDDGFGKEGKDDAEDFFFIFFRK